MNKAKYKPDFCGEYQKGSHLEVTDEWMPGLGRVGEDFYEVGEVVEAEVSGGRWDFEVSRKH